ncbi:glycerophosphodiester phosphodiesterase family protein [Marinivivus vitaminiproducens]|uniref:glycerophosphodiester phosphodiesterase family protein n=1 Tax=Marinivivus vitaminiproducens TaxID=3035935 RepID=UPI0027AA0D23|nr:glycerophosphodiester phosphodiesterase family protein [Geminicoccaceae bacterium SCSIO 64248]
MTQTTEAPVLHLPPWAPDRPNAAPGLPRVIGHRGAAALAPENTLDAIEAAHRAGARWVEFDVKLTGDGVPILFHDAVLTRTTGAKGKVARTSWAAIRGLDAGRAFGRPARVPAFAEAIDLLGTLGLGANVEIKPCPGREAETTAAALATIAERWPDHLPPPLVSSFARPCLAAARERAPHLPRGLLAERLPLRWRALMLAYGCATLHLSQRHLDTARVARLRATGVPLLVYTVNDPARARVLIEAGAQAVISDAPDAVAAALA